jgi:hypothetical protein
MKIIELEELINEYERFGGNKPILFMGKNSKQEHDYFMNKYDICFYSYDKLISDRFYTIDTETYIIKKK